MDYLNTFMPLQEEIVFKSLEKKVFNLLADGKTGAWLAKKNDEYTWAGEYHFDFDLLKNFGCIRESMEGKNLILTFKEKLFTAELIYRKRVGGYKEPFEDVCVASASAHSLIGVLNGLNNKLKKPEENVSVQNTSSETSVVDFQTYRLKRKLKCNSK